MKNSSRVLTACILVLGTCATIGVMASRIQRIATPTQQPSDKRKEKVARLKIHDFHGEAGMLRAKQLRTVNKGVARAMKDAEKRGLRQAFEHGRVILGTDPQDSRANDVARSDSLTIEASPFRPASYRLSYPQDTFTDGEYEVTFIPYDDGDPNTWEGIIYRYDPDWGDDIRFAILDISTEEPQVTQEVYYPSGGGDPEPIDPNGGPSPIISKNQSRARPDTVQYQSVKVSSCPGCGYCPPPNKCCLRLSDECCTPPPNLNTWFRCSARGCLGAAGGCSRSGPAWGECWGFGCSGAMLLCLF
jgi:hypothetical protein